MKGWVLAVISLVIYGMSVFGGFVQDDRPMIEFNPYMGERSQLLKAWISPYFYSGSVDGLYRPLTSFSFYFNGFMTGYQAWGFRLVNVLLYAGLSWLVFEALKLFVGKRQAFLLALVFAVFPVHTEAVNNIVGRAEILSLGFFLLSLIFLNKKKWEVSAFWFLLALFSKETAIVGLPVLLYLLSFEKKEKKTGVTLFCLATVLYLVLRLVVLGEGNWVNSATVVENPLKYMGVEERVRNAFALVTFGVGKIVFPLNLSYDYSFNQIPLAKSWLDWRVILGVVMMGLSLGSLLTKLRHNRAWIVGQALFWGPLLVTGNFFFAAQSSFGERRMMWPSLGLLLIIVGLRSVTRRIKDSKSVLIKYLWLVLILVLAFRTGARNVDWLSEEKLYIGDAVYAKNSVKAQMNRAQAFLNKKNLESAREALESADRIYPKDPRLLYRWGRYYLLEEDLDQARAKYEECLVVWPDYPECLYGLSELK